MNYNQYEVKGTIIDIVEKETSIITEEKEEKTKSLFIKIKEKDTQEERELIAENIVVFGLSIGHEINVLVDEDQTHILYFIIEPLKKSLPRKLPTSIAYISLIHIVETFFYFFIACFVVFIFNIFSSESEISISDFLSSFRMCYDILTDGFTPYIISFLFISSGVRRIGRICEAIPGDTKNISFKESLRRIYTIASS